MSTVAFIPLRGGSKSIPLKNIKLLAGKPLAHWTITAALKSTEIDKVVVSTDSEEIKAELSYLSTDKLEFYDRSEENAQDSSSTESAMLEYFNDRPCNTVILIQATSPLLTSTHLNEALELFNSEKTTTRSMLSVVNSKRFFWKSTSGNFAEALNYDYKSRPRRQDFEGAYVENGAFYIVQYKNFVKTSCRLSEPVMFYEMPENTYIELDEPSDWEQVERQMQRDLPDLSNIKLFVTDVDGVLTDSGMYYTQDDNELKKFNTRDGKGLELLRNKGLKIAIITSEHTKIVENRAAKLKVDYLYQGSLDKISALNEICTEMNIGVEQVAYIGDDINDLSAITEVGFSFSPSNAVNEVKNVVNYICSTKGGEGCVREAAEIILSNLK